MKYKFKTATSEKEVAKDLTMTEAQVFQDVSSFRFHSDVEGGESIDPGGGEGRGTEEQLSGCAEGGARGSDDGGASFGAAVMPKYFALSLH